MSIIKEVIKSNGEDTTIKFGLGIDNNLSGIQQEIDELTEDTKQELVNPIIDNEVRRYENNGSQTIEFYFKNFSHSGGPFNSSFKSDGAGFTDAEIESSDDVIRNSFFIMDFYDTFNNNTQTKIFTTYLTQILNGNTYLFKPIPKYTLFNRRQWYHQYIPKSFLDAQTGYTITGYTKFSFYNAKYGTLSLFYDNDSSTGLIAPETMYFKTYLNTYTMQWEFDLNTLHAYEVSPDNAYATKVNNTFENFDNLKQNPPIGVFNPEDGTYEGGSGVGRRGSRGGRSR